MKTNVLSLLLALLLSLFLLAGLPQAVAQDQGVEAPSATPNSEQDLAAESEEELAEEGVSEVDGEESDDEGPRRFIPTEEISQDLGVSFPVDI